MTLQKKKKGGMGEGEKADPHFPGRKPEEEVFMKKIIRTGEGGRGSFWRKGGELDGASNQNAVRWEKKKSENSLVCLATGLGLKGGRTTLPWMEKRGGGVSQGRIALKKGGGDRELGRPRCWRGDDRTTLEERNEETGRKGEKRGVIWSPTKTKKKAVLGHQGTR